MLNKIWLIVTFSIISLKAITPTDVFIEAKSIKLAIASMVNRDIGVSLLPVIDIDLNGAKPANVYAMGSALNQKIRLQMLLKNIKGWSTKEYPNEKIAPKDVRELMFVIKDNLKKLDSSINFKQESASNKTPVDVMQELVFANLWMDKFLATKAKPMYPYQIVKKIEHEVEMVMDKLGIQDEERYFEKYSKIIPRDVFIKAEVTYLTLAIFEKVKLGNENPLKPYDILSSKIDVKPIDVFTISVYILNYVYSLKRNFDFKLDTNYSPKFEKNIKPSDVFFLYDNVHYDILKILEYFGGKK